MAGKVYIVTCGEYSDYRIKACFSTRELAEAFINEPKIGLEPMYGDGCEIEEYDLDEEPKIHLARAGVYQYGHARGEGKSGQRHAALQRVALLQSRLRRQSIRTESER